MVYHTMPTDSQAFVSSWKEKPLDGMVQFFDLCSFLSKFGEIGLVEQVRDGATLRVRLFMSDGSHQMVNISLAGVKSSRASTRPGESSEPWGEEVDVLPS